MRSINQNREFLKAHLWEEWDSLIFDQRNGIPHPHIQKPYPNDSSLIELISPENFSIGEMSVVEAIRKRGSQRSYTGEAITIEELSYLLWASQGVHRVLRDGEYVLRTVPSAGARHPFESYLLINFVDGIETGLYRYLSIEHKLLPIKIDDLLVEEIHNGSYEQYVLDSAVVFIWTAIPYRAEWRYGLLAHKMIAQDSGHVCQNLYLACASIGVGTCAIGAYNQKKMDEALGVDGENEFTVYMATVGNNHP